MDSTLCEVRDTGKAGAGVFAKVDIPAHTQIVSEDLYWVYPPGVFQGESKDYFEVGNIYPQTDISIRNGAAAAIAYWLWKDEIPLDDPRLANLHRGLHKNSTPTADAHSWLKVAFPGKQPPLEVFTEYYERVVPNYINGTLIIEPNKSFGAGLAREFSKINHQCLMNNCSFVVIPQHVFVYTKRDIKAGEELTISYGTDKDIIKPETVKTILGFDCQCLTHTADGGKSYPYTQPDPYLAQVMHWYTTLEEQTREHARELVATHGNRAMPDSKDCDKAFMIQLSEALVMRFRENAQEEIVRENIMWAQLYYVATMRYGYTQLNQIRAYIFLFMAYITLGFYYTRVHTYDEEKGESQSDKELELRLSQVGGAIISKKIVDATNELYPGEPRILNHWKEICPAIIFQMDPIPLHIGRFERLAISDWRVCMVCFKTSTKWCPRCKQTYYCSAKCQNEDWKIHKQECASLIDTDAK